MKKKLLSIFVLCANLLTINTCFAEDGFNVNKFKLTGNTTFGYDYSFGFSKLESGKALLDKTNNIILDDRFRSSVYIDNVSLGINYDILEIVKLNLSTDIVSNNLKAEPLYNLDSYNVYKNFILDRKNNLKNVMQRFAVIKDVNFVFRDRSLDGNLTVGQQLIPFGYSTTIASKQPISSYPDITPMVEYINFNLRKNEEMPYQNSTLANIRDIGMSLNGNYTGFNFTTAVYNGSGTNSFDNNNEKDFFGRFDYQLMNNLASIGVSHLQGKHVGYRNMYALEPKREDFDLYKTGAHIKVGDDKGYLAGEVLFNQEFWGDKTNVFQSGWYAEAFFKAQTIFSGLLRYETFSDNNVLKNSAKFNYSVKRFVGTLSQSLNEKITLRQEYMHTWEDLKESSSKNIYSNYGIFSVTTNISF